MPRRRWYRVNSELYCSSILLRRLGCSKICAVIVGEFQGTYVFLERNTSEMVIFED
jgi:hypothetical protein